MNRVEPRSLPVVATQPASSCGASGENDFSTRVMYTYLVGFYLVVNAIRDAYSLIEGPDCIHMKTQYIQGNHDWMSTLTTVSGVHRVANTALHPVHMVRSREDRLRELMMKMAARPSTAGLLLTSMPMAFITGADYERLCRDVAEKKGKEVIHVPGKSLSGDWLDGYAETLLALARQLKLAPSEASGKDPKRVGIVGYLYDRNEGDHRANIRHLRSMLTELGLDPVSIWLEGQDFNQLGQIGQAGTILSFPYARRAAKALAQRTGAKLIECELPFGLGATERWLRQLGQQLDCATQAEALIDRELARVVPQLEWVIPYIFQNRRMAFIGDPHIARGMKEIAETLGARLSFAVITNTRTHVGKMEQEFGDTEVLIWSKAHAMHKFITQRLADTKLNLMVANNAGIGMADSAATIEFGFPSFLSHALYDRPFLGFDGFLAFVDSLANASRMFEAQQALLNMSTRK